MSIVEMIGKRVLLRSEKGIVERKIVELSPSGKFVKLDAGSHCYWRSISFVEDLLLEVL